MDTITTIERGTRPEPTEATRPTSDFMRRLHEALAQSEERRQQVRGGGPEEMPELDRELTMLQGATTSVQTRLADLVAAMTPVLGVKTLTGIADSGEVTDVRRDEQFPIETGYGQRMRNLQRDLSEVEAVLSQLTHGIRA